MHAYKMTLWSLLLILSTSGSAFADWGSKAEEPEEEEEKDQIVFALDRSPGIVNAHCLKKAKGFVKVTQEGPVEVMKVWLEGLPPHIDLELFVTQVPNFPFGLSWYQGDLETDSKGRAHGVFVGRFNIETFVVAPGEADAPAVHDGPFPDAETNPVTGPVHTFHLGIWFDDPHDAAKVGCPDVVTPFNGEHDAGVQLFNTARFPDDAGPLSQLQ